MSDMQNNDPEQALNMQGVADLLGVSKYTVRRRYLEGALPAVRVGNLLRFRRSQVIAYMDANTVTR